MFAKLVAVVLTLGVCGYLLALHGNRAQVASELAQTQLRIDREDEQLWILNSRIAARVTPSEVERMAADVAPARGPRVHPGQARREAKTRPPVSRRTTGEFSPLSGPRRAPRGPLRPLCTGLLATRRRRDSRLLVMLARVAQLPPSQRALSKFTSAPASQKHRAGYAGAILSTARTASSPRPTSASVSSSIPRSSPRTRRRHRQARRHQSSPRPRVGQKIVAAVLSRATPIFSPSPTTQAPLVRPDQTGDARQRCSLCQRRQETDPLSLRQGPMTEERGSLREPSSSPASPWKS